MCVIKPLFGGLRECSINVIAMTKTETPFGYQPVRVVLYERHISQREAARDIGVSWRHFRNCVTGRTHPMDIVREKLPVYLGVPLEDLFTPELLAKPYIPRTKK